MVFGSLELSAAQIFLVAFKMSFDLHELVEQLIVLQNLDVFHMEVGLIIAFESLVWLSWIDTLQNAKLSKVLQRDL